MDVSLGPPFSPGGQREEMPRNRHDIERTCWGDVLCSCGFGSHVQAEDSKILSLAQDMSQNSQVIHIQSPIKMS